MDSTEDEILAEAAGMMEGHRENIEMIDILGSSTEAGGFANVTHFGEYQPLAQTSSILTNKNITEPVIESASDDL